MPVLHRLFRKQYPLAVRGEGVHLWDETGKRYVDFSGSAAVNLIGHGEASVWKAVAEQARKLEFVHSSQFTTAVAEEFAAELLAYAGKRFAGGQVFFTCGGSEAVETALKLARQYQVEAGQPKRYRILSRQQAYHGATLGALAASGNKRRREIYLPLVREGDAFLHVGMPYCFRCPYKCNECGAKYAKEFELALGESRGTVAAFIAEPMSGATLGAVAPPKGYFERVSELCHSQGIVFIADEVMTGCGRTGRNLAIEHFGGEPDIVVLAKGLTSGYLPLGAVLATRGIVEAIERGSGALAHGFTYNGHPLAVRAAQAVFAILRKKELGSRAATLEKTMRGELEKLQKHCRSIGDVRGKGLLWGVEFVQERRGNVPYAPDRTFAARVGAECMRRGVLVYPMQGCVDGISGDHLLLAPPAVISKKQIAECCEALTEAVQAVERRS